MKISGFEWDAGNILHLTLGHGIDPEEAEEVFAVAPLFRKTKHGHYAVFGRADSGRLLVIVFEYKKGGAARVITGWDMSEAERRHYLRKERGFKMKKGGTQIREESAEYYDKHGILEEIEDKPVEFSLDTELRQQILEGKRMRHLQNISIKIDPVQILALKKLATMKAIPYQTLIRHWLAENIRKELHIVSK
jgi:uncharacterized DUF497 family protein